MAVLSRRTTAYKILDSGNMYPVPKYQHTQFTLDIGSLEHVYYLIWLLPMESTTYVGCNREEERRTRSSGVDSESVKLFKSNIEN